MVLKTNIIPLSIYDNEILRAAAEEMLWHIRSEAVTEGSNVDVLIDLCINYFRYFPHEARKEAERSINIRITDGNLNNVFKKKEDK